MSLRAASRDHYVPAIGAGVISAFLFFLFSNFMGGGILFLFLPCMPLLLIGLSRGKKQSGIACAAAMVVAATVTGPAGGIFFTAFAVIPVCYFVHYCMQWRNGQKGFEWYPVIRILSDLTVIAAAALMVAALGTAHEGGLHSLIPPHFVDRVLKENFNRADPDFVALMRQLFDEFSFVLFAMFGWLWVIIFYGATVLANALLKTKSLNLRPSLSLEPGGLSGWLPLLVLITAMLAILGRGIDRFTAETLFLLLLLPYLLSGIAWAHAFSIRRHLYLRKLWVTCFYIALRWTLVPVILIGISIQAAEMLDRVRKMR